MYIDPFEAKEIYALNGKLGLAEIVEDGLNVVNPNHPALHIPTEATDKAAPSFGSYVQFVITRALTGLGPVWTVKRFKGPGGSNGLFNAKRLDTDSVLITFAPQADTTKQTDKQVHAAAEVQTKQTEANSAKAKSAELGAAAKRAAAEARARKAHLATSSRTRRLSAAAKRQIVDAADQATAVAQNLDQQYRAAQAVAKDTQAALDDAKARQRTADEQAATDKAAAPAAAINAAQTLQQTMILQNLVGALQPR